MGLGFCQKCGAELCLSGRMVECVRCRHAHPMHPLLAQLAPERATPPAPVIPPQDYAHTIPDRLRTVEQKAQRLEQSLAELAILVQRPRDGEYVAATPARAIPAEAASRGGKR